MSRARSRAAAANTPIHRRGVHNTNAPTQLQGGRLQNAAGAPDGGGSGGGGGNDGDTYTSVVGYERAPTAAKKMGNSLMGLLVGPVLILLGCLLLWNNESWAIKTHRSLHEALDAHVVLDPTNIHEDNSKMNHRDILQRYDNRLVHVSGSLQVDAPVIDPQFDLSRSHAVTLTRIVEIYQWQETISKERRKLQNGETQVLEHVQYHKKWVDSPISSHNFREHGYENVGTLPFSTQSFRADTVRLKIHPDHEWTLVLSPTLVSQLRSSREVSVRDIPKLPAGAAISGNQLVFLQDKLQLLANNNPKLPSNHEDLIEEQVVRVDGEEKTLFVLKHSGDSYSTRERALEAAQTQRKQIQQEQPPNHEFVLSNYEPSIGDVRVRFQEAPCTTVSVLARLVPSSGDRRILTNWQSRYGSGYDVAILQSGYVSADDMISDAQSANAVKTWLLRGGGWLLNMIGFSLITSIVTTTADIGLHWIPLLGPMATSIIRLGVSVANFILGTSLTLLVASVAWIVYRPVLGLSLLVGSLGIFITASRVGKDGSGMSAMGKTVKAM